MMCYKEKRGLPPIPLSPVFAENNAPTFTGTPTITGIAKVGEMLGLADTGTNDIEGDTVTLSYQWAIDGVAIPGATLDTYELVKDDGQKNATCIITADDGNADVSIYTTSGVYVKNNFPWWSFWPAILKTFQDRSTQR